MAEEKINFETELKVEEKRRESVEEKKLEKSIEMVKKEVDIFDILKLVSPGTSLRIAIDDIVKARTGALIVVINKDVAPLIEGGFRVNCAFTYQRLMELCKMDGAVILSEDLKKILYANVLLIPNPSIPSSETGTRHKAAERTAKQASTLVIAVSERRGKVTLYYAGKKYVLGNTEDILRRATGALQILEKQREIYDELFTNLSVLEVTGLVSVSDVCEILQRIEMINRIEEMVKKSIVELGKEGSIVKMRLRELTKNIDKIEQLILKDYTNKPDRIRQLISDISFDDLIDTAGMSKLLFNKASEETIMPKGYRFLGKTDLNEEEVRAFILNFKNLNNILSLGVDDINKILKDEDFSHEFQKELAKLRENVMVGKKL